MVPVQPSQRHLISTLNDVLYVTNSESIDKKGYGYDPKFQRRHADRQCQRPVKSTYFIPDPDMGHAKPDTSAAEGVWVDPNGVIYGAEVGPRRLFYSVCEKSALRLLGELLTGGMLSACAKKTEGGYAVSIFLCSRLMASSADSAAPSCHAGSREQCSPASTMRPSMAHIFS